jgi:phosphoglycolate phosphatase-like HAD superfamily hydrolase
MASGTASARSGPPKVLLFDVDGTLISAGGAGRRAVERALAHHFGSRVAPRPVGLRGMRLDGMTDRLIVRLVMEALELPFDDSTCDRVLESYVDFLASEIHGPGYAVLPGVEELLAGLEARGAVLGLCTGNVARGARIKLARGGLDRYFGFGEGDVNGFAHDGEERERIVAAALRRASARMGRPLLPGEALVIGDTPRDVAAARAVGVPVLAVATGRFTEAELAGCGADRVLPSLSGPGVQGLLLGSGAA